MDTTLYEIVPPPPLYRRFEQKSQRVEDRSVVIYDKGTALISSHGELPVMRVTSRQKGFGCRPLSPEPFLQSTRVRITGILYFGTIQPWRRAP